LFAFLSRIPKNFRACPRQESASARRLPQQFPARESLPFSPLETHLQIIEAAATAVKRLVLIKHQSHRLYTHFAKIQEDEVYPQFGES
jgi:hypothetical protein